MADAHLIWNMLTGGKWIAHSWIYGAPPAASLEDADESSRIF